MTSLSPTEQLRYSRHLMLPEIGLAGQQHLKDASVLVVGAGGLGSPLLMYLAAAGVGRIGIMDDDTVSLSNLHRQVLFGSGDIGQKKALAAADRLAEINPAVRLETFPVRLTSENALDLIGLFDIVADGTDNFETRYLINDACVLSGRPNVYASIFRFEGQVSVFGARNGPCYRCLYPVPPEPDLVPSCAEAGVLGVLPGVVGALQATEVIKLVCGVGEPLVGRVLHYDALSLDVQVFRSDRNPDCPICGDQPTQTGLIDYEAFCGASKPPEVPGISATALRDLLAAKDAPALLDVRSSAEHALVHLPGLLIPLAELSGRLSELDHLRNRPLVAYCRTGVRSARAVSLLREAGFQSALNLEGGLHAWSDAVDPSVPKY